VKKHSRAHLARSGFAIPFYSQLKTFLGQFLRLTSSQKNIWVLKVGKCIKLSLPHIILHSLNWTPHNFKIEERRREVASLLCKSITETQIAKELGVDQSTISRDVKILKELSQRFVYDLAKSDLAYYYKQSIDGIEEAKKESWKIYNDELVPVKEKLLALKIIIQSNEARFKLLSEGPSVLAVKSLEDRLSKVESFNQQQA
jgi:DNA-binding transcriptional ArsR family regulator